MLALTLREAAMAAFRQEAGGGRSAVEADHRGGSNQYPASLKRQDCTLVTWYRFFTHLAREGRMTVTIGRRELLAALGGVAAACALAARGQQPGKLPTIGFLGANNASATLRSPF